MTRPQRIHFVAKQTGITKAKVKAVYDAIMGLISHELATTGELVIRDFGRFTVEKRMYKMRLPTMKHLEGKHHFVLKFKPYPLYKAQLTTEAPPRPKRPLPPGFVPLKPGEGRKK